jgi:hypothetical protein
VLVHKSSLNKYRKIEEKSCIPPDHKGIKPEINHKRNSRKHSNTWKLNNTLLNEQ